VLRDRVRVRVRARARAMGSVAGKTLLRSFLSIKPWFHVKIRLF